MKFTNSNIRLFPPHKGTFFGLQDINHGLQHQITELKDALAKLEGKVSTITIDPANPEAAIREMEQLLDQRVGNLSRDSWAAGIIGEAKAKYAARIREIALNKKT